MILSELCMELKGKNLHAQLHHMPVMHAMAQEMRGSNGYDDSSVLF